MNILSWFLIISFNFIITTKAYSVIEELQLDNKFIWIRTDSKVVKARLGFPKDGLSICWIEVEDNGKRFEFISRKAFPYEECLSKTLAIRRFLHQNTVVEIIGGSPMKDSENSFSAFWEVLRAGQKCLGHFGDCETFNERHTDLIKN